MLKRAEKLSEIPAAFPPAPLTDDEFREFYVEADCERDSCLSRMNELKKKLARDNIKIFFAGHRGSGKSTELNRLKMDIREDAFVVQFSVIEELDINDITYIDLIMIMMEKIADKAHEAGFLKKDSKYIVDIKNWLADVTEIKAENTGYMMEVKAGLKTNRGILSPLIGLFAEFKAAVKASSDARKEYRKKLEQKISLLKAYCNILINAIEIELKRQDKKMVLIIEDLDKADISRVHEIFFRHSGILADLNTQIIFTVSIFALTTPNLADLGGRFEMVSLPMLKVNDKNGGPFEKGRSIIKAIVEKRADISLFEKDILEDMIVKSGGVLRDLFEMIEVAATSADFNRRSSIDGGSADYAFERLKAKYRGMIIVVDEKESKISTDDLYNRLVAVSTSKTKEFALDPTMLLLLSCLAVVEYNGRQWFDAHPAVKSLLEGMGRLQ
jgi:hypothetical protein